MKTMIIYKLLYQTIKIMIKTFTIIIAAIMIKIIALLIRVLTITPVMNDINKGNTITPNDSHIIILPPFVRPLQIQ